MRATAILLLFVLTGCDNGTVSKPEPRPAPTSKPVDTKKVLVGKNVFLEVQGDARRVLVSGEVCKREGALEVLVCRKATKEHESILVVDADARTIHLALIRAGAKEGSPVRFMPEYKPAHGTTIRVSVAYELEGKLVRLPANKWIRRVQSGKELDSDWVFAGSQLVPDPTDLTNTQKLYLANTDGYYVGVSNFETALLDLPIRSPKDNADLAFEAFTDRIPPVGTPVAIVLEPVLEKPK